MQQYFIIDQKHYMHLQEGKNMADAKDKFNDRHAIKSDIAMQAQPCVHKKYIIPDVPEWMEYTPTASSLLCLKCSTPKEPDNHLQDEPLFFSHSKNYL